MATTTSNQPTTSGARNNAANDKNVAPNTTSKRTKGKKAADPVDTSKAIEDTIAQLERNKAGDKEQEMEIEREVKKANRDLSNLLSTLETPMSRIEIVQRKYTELLAEMKRTERDHIKSKKRADQLQKERDSSRSELNKTTTVKDKLEKLCRELQKENKKLKEEKEKIGEDETNMREELHERLEGMVLNIQDFIAQKDCPQPEHQDLDDIFRQKFKSFLQQYELRELQFSSLLRSKDLELSHLSTLYANLLRSSEAESQKSRQLTSQVSTFSKTESELRSQLNIYVEKFKQVEDTLNNSNDLFLTFRKEMEEMSKKTKRLERENQVLQRKQEASRGNVAKMAEERTKNGKELDALRRKNENLEKLCRGMQQQGRGLANAEGQGLDVGVSDHGTESEYDYDDEDDEGEDEEASEDDEFEDGAEEIVRQESLPVFGPVPPPPKQKPDKAMNGRVNGVAH